MKIVLASDLDGTLLKDNLVPNYNMESIEKLNSNGGMFMIATGRPFNGVSYLFNNTNLKSDYNILLNGALIIDKFNKVILHKVISFDYVEKIISHVSKYNPYISLETGFKTFLIEKDICQLPYPEKNLVNSIYEVESEDISLISLFFDTTPIDEIDTICKSINEEFSDQCVAFRNTNFIDVVPKNCSKGDAISYICTLEDITKDNLFTIGDSFNDVSMFNITENSFTFHHCEDDLKSIASNVVDSVSECIENYMLCL